MDRSNVHHQTIYYCHLCFINKLFSLKRRMCEYSVTNKIKVNIFKIYR